LAEWLGKMAEQSGISLSPFLASVEFHALRGKVVFKDFDTPVGKDRLIAIVEGKPVIFTAYTPSSRSHSWEIAGDPRFWEKVKQLSFAFDRKDWGAIREFYTRYGLVSPFFVTATEGADLAAATQGGVTWFRHLTNITEWVKNKKLSPLREFFSGEEYGVFRSFPLLFSRLNPLKTSQEETGDSWEETTIAFDLIKYTTRAVLNVAASQGKELGLAPQFPTLKDHELIGYTWDLIARMVGAKLETIELVPVYQQQTKSIPPVVWYFRAYCALDAAFLQWYFQEVAPLMVRTCEAPGCNAPVLDPRAKYCSQRCYWRAKKKRYVERKRLIKSGVGDGIRGS